jgi:hypothetical protein
VVSKARIDVGPDCNRRALAPFEAALRRHAAIEPSGAAGAAGVTRGAAQGGRRLTAYVGKAVAVGEAFARELGRTEDFDVTAFKVTFPAASSVKEGLM